MHRPTRAGVALVALVLVVIAGALAVRPWPGVAQEDRSIDVEVAFLPNDETAVRGDPCGYLNLGEL